MRFPNLLLFPFKKKKEPQDDNGLEYASFSGRSFALTFDMLLLFLLLFPLFGYLSQVIFPEFYANQGEQKVQALFQAMAMQQITTENLWQELQALGVMEKMLVDYSLQFLISGAIIVFFWVRFDTTPGLFLFRMHIADAKTGESPTFKQYVIRYIATVISTVPFMVGMFWIFFNSRKMALQDVVAQTVVIKRKIRWFKPKSDSE